MQNNPKPSPRQRPVVHLIAAARPNFMKAAPLYHALVADRSFDVTLIHTGQHYDDNMSGAFFRDLCLPDPDVNLDVGSGRHGKQTAAVIERYETYCLDHEMPDWTIVIGDVNSTVGCALTAAKIGVKIAHLEAGLRSNDRTMPEEINRVMTDAIADVLWTPSADADVNLLREGVPASRIDRIGNIMIDSYVMQEQTITAAAEPAKYGLAEKNYGVITLHRPSNVDDAETLRGVVSTLVLASKKMPMIWPVHPRTRQKLRDFDLMDLVQQHITLVEPLGYVPFMSLVRSAALVVTDSGGVQEETTYIGVPCLTMRPNTERPTTIFLGTNVLVTPESLMAQIDKAMTGSTEPKGPPPLWDGAAAKRAVESLKRHHGAAQTQATQDNVAHIAERRAAG